MKYNSIAILGLACVVGHAGATLAMDQSATPVLPIFVDYETPPRDIAELATSVDAVAVVRVQGKRFENPLDALSGRSRDITKYVVRVVETLKLNPMLPSEGSVFEITRLGGQHIENGQVVKSAVKGFEEFEQDGEYLLFLTWNGRSSTFDIAFGPNGSFQLLPTGNVRSLGQAEVAAKQQAKGRGTFLAELRSAIGR